MTPKYLDAFPMIGLGMVHQVAPAAAPDLGTPPPETPYYGSGETLPVTDLGIEGHAAQRYAHEDRRDDGRVVGSAAPDPGATEALPVTAS